MLFNSFEFLLFFPVVFIGFFITPYKYRWIWLLAASYFFYMVHSPKLVIFLLISTTVDYYAALKMARATARVRKYYLALSIAVNIGMLCTFKYLAFFSNTINQLLVFLGMGHSSTNAIDTYNFSQLLLPIGISFYTFQTLSYTIDVYRRKIEPETHLGWFALYVCFFPQLVAGPIERASRLLPQLKRQTQLHLPNIKQGLVTMAWGFFLKVVVADRLGVYVDEAFENAQSPHGIALFLGALFFCFQIYFDFSAYTAIAIGTAKTLNIDLMQNFNRPFFSTSARQFWKRWHISFMHWLRDYLYQPLVKNYKLSRVTAILIVFFVNGLWHGANWTFVVWSLLNAVLLIIEVSTNKIRQQLIKKLKLPQKVVAFLGWAIVGGYLMLSLVFFRATSIEHAVVYIKSMFQFGSLHINILNNYIELAICLVLIILVQTVHYFKGNNKIHELVIGKPTYIRWSIYISFIAIISLFAINRQNTFIYFQF
ncbi:Peptidoglycan O-acetyltransferase [Mariniflexile rhizosphaerae]|nr:MBOAT family O-acyltransferase [Mariniflexile sp. TRM1-10]AXP82456.1 Peptidoglycan O-acetyltransferase [Mariniflexile sp. TRM1-10]